MKNSISNMFEDWIGRVQERSDSINPRLVASFVATLTPNLAKVSAVPLGVHWCLAPDIATQSELGEDGHPKKGGFLPPIPFGRRMWAGGELEFFDDFDLGADITRHSQVKEIEKKAGRSGLLFFVTVEHLYQFQGHTILKERHNIVYREGTLNKERAAEMSHVTNADFDLHWDVEADSVMLFRFSALTFNGHRIHYDRPYAVQTEGYSGLVVHGPLQATLLLNISAALAKQRPNRFVYRSLRPLIAPQTMGVYAKRDGSQIRCWTQDSKGSIGMDATASIA